MIEILRTNSNNKSFGILVFQLNNELLERYGEIQNEYNKHNILGFIDTVVIAFEDKSPIGCGCYKRYSEDTVEIKRMFIDKSFRGKGISKMILNELEGWAIENGFKKAMLETGIYQPEAVNLYLKAGYQKIDNYTQYAGMEASICMFKEL